MIKIPSVPQIATITNYPAGVNPWNGQPTRVALPGSWASYGIEPNVLAAAQHRNYLDGALTDAVRDLQATTYGTELAGGRFTTVAGFAYYLGLSANVVLFDGGNSLAADPTFHRGNEVASVAASGFNVKGAAYQSGTTIKVAGFELNAAGNSADSIDIMTDGILHTYVVGILPHAGAVYTHACQDVTTGRFVAISGNVAGAADAGWASGDPAALTFVPFTIGVTAWAIQERMSCASKPGETRAFSKTLTVATTDGGVTSGTVVPTVWSGGTPTGNMFPPCWDSQNNRWVCGVSAMSVSAFNSGATSQIWTSTDGVTWTKLADSPSMAMLHMVEHRGWLYAIGRKVGILTTTGGNGLYIAVSKDGGATWSATGSVLCMDSLGFTSLTEGYYHHMCRIEKAGTRLIFMTTISTTAPGTLPAGKGLDYAVFQVSGEF
jgi:hypothetical protein